MMTLLFKFVFLNYFNIYSDDTLKFTKENEHLKPPSFRQTFVFSATLIHDSEQSDKLHQNQTKTKSSKKSFKSSSPTLKQLMSKLALPAHQTIHVSANPKSILAENLTESKMELVKEDKDAGLYYILSRYPGTRTLVFMNSIDAIRRLVPVLKLLGIEAVGLHAEMQQRQRLKNLDKYVFQYLV
jgi:ATP-dependent RNA helicase DDX24/MAK5